MAANVLLLHFVQLFFSIISVAHALDAEPVLQDFPNSAFQRHITASRHQPFCVVFREPGLGSQLELSIVGVWRTKQSSANYTKWELGSYTPDKKSPLYKTHGPKRVPSVRCYLGETSRYDYPGLPWKKELRTWLTSLSKKYDEQMLDVTEKMVADTIQKYRLVLIAFPTGSRHLEIEDIIYKLASEHENSKPLIVHEHAPDIIKLKKRFGILQLPAVVVIHSNGNLTSGSGGREKLFSGLSVDYKEINIYLRSMEIPASRMMSLDEFEARIKLPSKGHFQPLIGCFYAYWAPQAFNYLSMFKKSVEEFNDLGADLEFVLFDLTEDFSKTLVNRKLNSRFTHKVPFTVLFYQDKKGQIVPEPLKEDRPTPWLLYKLLNDVGFGLVDKNGQQIDYLPWGTVSIFEITPLYEGPYGTMCSSWSHNMSDNTPKEHSLLGKEKRKAKKKKDAKKSKWHEQLSKPNLAIYSHSCLEIKTMKVKPVNLKKKNINVILNYSDMKKFSTETIDKKLKKYEGIPLITSATWSEVIETSHVPQHNFYKTGKWAGEITKVALVVFIVVNCRSCNRGLDAFKELQSSVRFIDGGTMYMVNCTTEEALCQKHNIKGFPTIVAFRGLGWMQSSVCLTDISQKKFRNFVRQDYHGVIQTKPIMEWFSEMSANAIHDIKFGDVQTDFKPGENVRLIGVLMPKWTRYLPIPPKRDPNHYLLYECFRLACERMFGAVGCYSVYSKKIPAREFEDNDDLEVIVSKITFQRRDGLETSIMELGRRLHETFEDQLESNLHTFHKPHRYNIHINQKCEGNIAMCTDLVTEFTLDHSRLPVASLTSQSLHTSSSLLTEEKLPVLLALVKEENITEGSEFSQILLAHDIAYKVTRPYKRMYDPVTLKTKYKVLTNVAFQLYREMVVMTLNVDQYASWAATFIPKNYKREMIKDPSDPDPFGMFSYPRLCIIQQDNHNQAAFYPPVQQPRLAHYSFTEDAIIKFAQDFLDDPQSELIETDHF